MNTSFPLHRRAFLGRYVGAVGSLALADLVAATAPAHAKTTAILPDEPAKAKAVICLFQHGGPSHMDLFDPKPELTSHDGQPYPGELEVHFHEQKGNLLASPFKFHPAGHCGMPLSEILPHTARVADDLTLVRSMTTESVDHESALRLIHSGKFFAGRPVMGSWIVYGLGSENRDLPAYVVLSDPGGLPVDGVGNWSSGWLPAVFQGTPFRAKGSPVLHLSPPDGVTPDARRSQLDLLAQLNRAHLERHSGNSELEARISNFEMAARMQAAVPEILDLARETEATRRMYGMDNPTTAEYAGRCLLARRLVEQGVRFVQVFMSGQPWDTHSKNADSLRGLCARTDQPCAALVADLKQRGLLESTIVLWTGEFGRLPISQKSDGRDHNRHAFSLWLAGGGFKGGYVHGATDEFGYKSVQDVVTIHDLHATILAALGLSHVRLTYPHDGRDDSLTDFDVSHARVARELLA
ncbi:MAG: DUF1501 domain-containing protein [Planctomycetia bacterium]|nr:DUF1501 domain-containing protein [Planctomycetia bacterium]